MKKFKDKIIPLIIELGILILLAVKRKGYKVAAEQENEEDETGFDREFDWQTDWTE